MKKIILLLLLIMVSMGAYSAYQNASKTYEEKQFDANLDALSSPSSVVLVGTCGRAYGFKCFLVCQNCFKIWYADEFAGPTVKLTGVCTCGKIISNE